MSTRIHVHPLTLKTFRLHGFCASVCSVVLALLIIFSGTGRASTDPQVSDSPVSATVPSATSNPGGDTTPPTVPILIRPLDGSVTSDATPEFVWRQAEDPNSNYVAYTVYIDGTPLYLGVSSTGNSAKSGPAGYVANLDGTEVRLIPTANLSDGTHKWKVAAYDLSGNQSFSTEWSIVIDTIAPPITITDIDTHHSLSLSSMIPGSVTSETIFDVTGPKDIYLTIVTEPYTTLSITFTLEDGTVIGPVTGRTADQTSLSLYRFLEVGQYRIDISATDRANLVTVLPPFSVVVSDGSRPLPAPGASTLPGIRIPPAVTSFLYSYPATVQLITSRDRLSISLISSLAIGIVLLIIFLKKRSNLVLLHADRTPISQAAVRIAGNERIYRLKPHSHGRLYIPGLTKATELTVEYSGGSASMCISRTARRYYIYL